MVDFPYVGKLIVSICCLLKPTLFQELGHAHRAFLEANKA